MTPADRTQRERALDPRRSFIVQAPAGSGKTELLIQRYLTLLGGVERPESVVAITFTRKAAAEMQRRVLQALEAARGREPAKEHERTTWSLAKIVLERSDGLGWNLETNPRRLAIRTIDSLCASLAGRMPWVSRLGPRLEVVEDATDLFHEAARRTVELLEEDRYGDAIEPLLRHVDNNQPRLGRLLAAMLDHREQWLRHVRRAAPGELRTRFEGVLRRAVEKTLGRLGAAAPPFIAERVPDLARHAADNLRHTDKHPEIQHCRDLTSLPGARAADLPAWRGLQRLLLTNGRPRAPRGINATIGFPPSSRFKRRMCETVDELVEHPEFYELLAQADRLPDPAFDETQWAVLEALLVALPAAAGQLRLLFGERGQVDFAALTEAALCALGEDEAPTDLALVIDGRIEHLLVDEFQDTAHAQMRLLEKLTLGWTPGDGRTVFLVGDPMQSIYRFREAEVGLFLRTVAHGLPTVEIEPLRLSVNFRSRHNIVDWVNEVFPGVFAEKENVALGAVRFARSTCASEEGPGPAVAIHPFWDPEGVLKEGQPAAEAACVRGIVERARGNGETVAILARSRAHLPRILAELRAAGIRYRAVEVDPLASSSAVQDLMALTSALLHPADRISWLAILRAPWCGLSLADLHALASDAIKAAIPSLLAEPARVARLSTAGQDRLARLSEALRAPRPRTLRAWVEGVWLRLGGPATVAAAAGLDDAEAYFDLLERLDQGCDVDLSLLRLHVSRLFASPDPAAGDGVQVMTIHKAKGLEFDVVILPGLGRRAKSDEDKLMLWLEQPAEVGGGEGDLLLAPMKSAAVKSEAVYKYVQRLERQKHKHELARLLYVAATRAKHELHLLGAVKIKNGDVSPPASDTLLELLWPTVGATFAAPTTEVSPIAMEARPVTNLRRLSADWAPPSLRPPAVFPARVDLPSATVAESLRYRWAGQKLRLAGTVVHDMLQEIGREGAQAWSPERVRAARPRFAGALRAAGVGAEDLDATADKVEQAILGALADERGRWALDGTHHEARSEVALAGVVDGRVIERRVDRTFIDANGVRWVIDFKTSAYERDDVEAFLKVQMDAYRQQMEDYRAFYRQLEKRPVRIGLYFPLLGIWREYEETVGAAV